MPVQKSSVVILCKLVLALSIPSIAGCSGDAAPQQSVAKTGSVLAESDSALTQANAATGLIAAGIVLKNDDGGAVLEADLRNAAINDELLAKLADLSSLRVLNLAETSFSDAHAEIFERVNPRLTSLDLRGCELSDKSMPQIGRFTGLRSLRLSGKNGKTSFGDDGLKPLAGCKSLKVLALDDLWIGTAGLEALSGLTQLEELYLAGTVIDDSSINTIAGFPALKKLRLARTQVTDDALASLSSRGTLEELDLSETSLITDAGMVHLAKLTQLKKLNLWRVQISDEGILQLAPLTQLEWLNLDNTRLSDSGLQVLSGMSSLTFLHLGSTQVTAAGASALFHLKGLKDLKITRTALGSDDAAVASLKKNLPSTTVQTEYVEAEK